MPRGMLGVGADLLPLPGSRTGAARGPWELEVTGLMAKLVTADLMMAPSLQMLQGPERC